MKVSVTQYAKYRGITRQAVLKQIKKCRPLPHIKKIEMIGATYLLHTINDI